MEMRDAAVLASGSVGFFGGAELGSGGCPFASAGRVTLQEVIVLAAAGGVG